MILGLVYLFFFFQAEDGIRDWSVTGVQTCALPIYLLTFGAIFLPEAWVTLAWRALLPLPTAWIPHIFERGVLNHESGSLYLLRSEEHTSELQSLTNLVCRLLLEKKK